MHQVFIWPCPTWSLRMGHHFLGPTRALLAREQREKQSEYQTTVDTVIRQKFLQEAYTLFLVFLLISEEGNVSA
jgi:hypothetical protein